MKEKSKETRIVPATAKNVISRAVIPMVLNWEVIPSMPPVFTPMKKRRSHTKHVCA
jgi:hypothetical protein